MIGSDVEVKMGRSEYWRRLLWTIRICRRMFVIRQNGQYKHTVWDGQTSYAVWEYGGKTHYLPAAREDE